MKRAAISIGVNRAGTMTPLRAAAKGAKDFDAWAKRQGCETTLLVDRGSSRVAITDIFDAVKQYVDAGTYSQLIIYFSGHGILQAPGAEFWLLSRAPENPNEAVNLLRSTEDARNSGIPHVVFISDACRSSVAGPPLSRVTGGLIFPSYESVRTGSEIDVFYATRPGDPAYEVPLAEATKGYRGIFTDNLLKAVKAPKAEWIAAVDDGPAKLSVVASRLLKPHLETAVPEDAADVSIKLRQEPELRVESALPKFFAVVQAAAARRRRAAAPPPSGTTEAALNTLRPRTLGARNRRRKDVALADELGLVNDVERLAATHGRVAFETRTGFTVFGSQTVRADAERWDAFVFRDADGSDDADGLDVRLNPAEDRAWRQPSSIVFQFEQGTGTVLPILPGFVGTLVVEDGRLTSVEFVPSRGTPRYRHYERRAAELEQTRAFAAVASLNGRFVVDDLEAPALASRIRQEKGLDPTLGLYAAYAYAQVGRYKDVFNLFTWMARDEIDLRPTMNDRGIPFPVPFDVVMLAGRFRPDLHKARNLHVAPYAPMLSQGWVLLSPGDPMAAPLHEKLRRHLVPSLWTTLDSRGVGIARRALSSGAGP